MVIPVEIVPARPEERIVKEEITHRHGNPSVRHFAIFSRIFQFCFEGFSVCECCECLCLTKGL